HHHALPYSTPLVTLFSLIPRPPTSTLFPYTTLFRSKLEVWDSPNSAGIVIDAVRFAKLALNNGVAGALEGPSSYLMKSPPKQVADRKSTRLNSSHVSDLVCRLLLEKKKITIVYL